MRALALLAGFAVLVVACGKQTPATPEHRPANTSRLDQSLEQGIAAGESTHSLGVSTTGTVLDLPYVMRDLPNGLRVVLIKTDYPDVVALQIPVQTGSRNEVEPGKSGFAHFFEHMMFRGTENYSPEEYGNILKKAGADQNAYTSDDLTNYHITFSKDDLEQVLELEADRFQNLSYSEELFRTEAQAVKGEYLKNYSNPIQKLFEVTRDKAYTTHPYKHTTMGFFRDIEAMPDQMEYAQTFFDRWYRPEKTSIVIVGDIDPEYAFSLVEKYWGGWKRGDYSIDIPPEPEPQGPVTHHIEWEAPTQPWVTVAFHGPAFTATDKAMLTTELIGQLYFSPTSDLYQKLVVKERKVDQLFYHFPRRIDPGLLTIGARLIDPQDAGYVREAMNQAVLQARTRLVGEQRLTDLKSHVKYEIINALDNSEAIASHIARWLTYERTPETINAADKIFALITAEDMRSFANQYFTDPRRVSISLAQKGVDLGLADEVGLDKQVTELAQPRTPEFEFVEMPSSSPLVDISFLFNVGAVHDPEGYKGLAALTAAMIADAGTSQRNIKEIRKAYFPLASGLNYQLDKEMMVFSGRVHKDELDRWYALALEQLLSPGWDEEDFKRIKLQTINNIRTDLRGNNDEELAKEVLYNYIYLDEHPYGSLNLGEVSDIESITLDDVKAFYKDMITQRNLVVGLIGSYNRNFLERLQRDLNQLPLGSMQPVELPQPLSFKGHQALIIEKKTPATAVSFGFPISVRRGDPDWVALWLARSWLGEHRSFNGRLFQRIREVRGMNYGDYAYIEYFPRGMHQFHPDTNLGRSQQIFQIWIRPLRTANDAHFATRTAMYELLGMLEKGISEDDFNITRDYLSKFVGLLTKSQDRQLGYRLDSHYYKTDEFVKYVRDGLARLTADDVNASIKRHLQVDNVKFVFVTKDAQELRERLINNSSSPLAYNTEKNQQLYAEDKLIQDLTMQFSSDSVLIVPIDEVFE